MKAMLLAAGRGERLRPLTDHTAKPLLRAGGHRLIDYHLNALQQNNICDIIINTCWQADKITSELGNGDRYGVSIRYSHEATALETAGGIIQALPLLGEEPFLVISADVWGDFPLADLQLGTNDLARLLLVDNPTHHPHGDYALLNHRLRQSGTQRLTYSGVGLFHPQAFSKLEPGRRPLRDVLTSLIASDQITGLHYTGPWFDVGTAARLDQLNQYLQHESPLR